MGPIQKFSETYHTYAYNKKATNPLPIIEDKEIIQIISKKQYCESETFGTDPDPRIRTSD
jgi:hypothetical protein